ncbi:MAG TPA: DNA polymerase IV [Acidimicrobiales bacterium]|nr:DNA polymerase IV [Acidimicrobiales bacterium]
MGGDRARGGAATVLHADLDAFYASVEQLLDPALRDRPIAVGGGVVLAASYEARAFGVGAGMPARRARRLCPGLSFVPGHFADYRRLGDHVLEILGSFTPLVERVSIDEAFLDVAGAGQLFGSPADIATSIRRRVRAETGLPISVGVARTKHLAKIASQVAKPDGMAVVAPAGEEAFLAPLPVELMWGVGPATRARLEGRGIRTIGQLAHTERGLLDHLLGRTAGDKLLALAANVDPRAVTAARAARSVGAQAALGRRRPTPELLASTIGSLADRVAGRMRAAGRAGRTVTVRVRFTELRAVTRSRTLPAAVSATRTLAEVGIGLAGAALAAHRREPAVTLLGVSVSGLVPEASLQLELPFGPDDAPRPGTAAGAARWSADRAVDAVRRRFGPEAIGYAAVAFAEGGGVPDAFRQLAERALG